MRLREWLPTKSALIALACAIFLAIAVPLFGQKFEYWPGPAAIAYGISVLGLPIASIVGITTTLRELISGPRKPCIIISFLICFSGAMAYALYMLAFTGALG